MTKYHELFKNLFPYANAQMGFHPESMLRKHLELSNLKIERFKINYKLRGEYI
jgi:hypothetical protein